MFVKIIFEREGNLCFSLLQIAIPSFPVLGGKMKELITLDEIMLSSHWQSAQFVGSIGRADTGANAAANPKMPLISDSTLLPAFV